MKQSTKEYLIVFVLSLLLVVGSATGGYVGCTLACRDCCPAVKACPERPAKCDCNGCKHGDCKSCCVACPDSGQTCQCFSGERKCGCCPACPDRKPRDDPKKCCPEK